MEAAQNLSNLIMGCLGLWATVAVMLTSFVMIRRAAYAVSDA